MQRIVLEMLQRLHALQISEEGAIRDSEALKARLVNLG